MGYSYLKGDLLYRKQEELWNSEAMKINPFVGSEPRLNYIIKNIIKVKRTGKILEIGFGTGHLLLKLNAFGFNSFGVDFSDNIIQRLKKTDKDIQTKKVDIIREKLPFKDNFFDFVVASEVLEHIPTNKLSFVLSEIKRVLKKEGFFVGTVPYNESLLDFFVACLHCGKTFHRWGHYSSYNEQKILELLNSQNYKIVKLKPLFFCDNSIKGLIKKGVFKWNLFFENNKKMQIFTTLFSPNLFFMTKKQ